MKTRRQRKQENQGKSPLPVDIPIGRYGLIEDNLFREDEILECKQPVPEGVDLIQLDDSQRNVLKSMYDSMPKYQFLNEPQKAEFFRSRTDSYFLSLGADNQVRGLPHGKRVTFHEESEVRYFLKQERPQEISDKPISKERTIGHCQPTQLRI